MSSLISALDNYTPKHFGENGHAEYTWSNNIRERILQFSFQLTRTNEKGISMLASTLREMLISLKGKNLDKTIKNSERTIVREYLVLLYKIIASTRDIIDGKGECTLAYMMIHVWYEFYPEMAFYAIKCLVDFGDEGKTHQYGSWKDIKYFCNYCYKQKCSVHHPLIQYSINLVNIQVRKDMDNINSDEISLVGKWVPREKSSRFGWMYQPLACQYFSKYIQSAASSSKENSMSAAILKCKMEYRKILSTLNTKIDTVQIKQCGKTWSDINFNKVSSVTLSKQRKAFLNVNKKGQVKYPTNSDRIECAEHFNAHIQKAVKGEVEIKGKRVGLTDFTKQAIDLNKAYDLSSTQIEKDVLNSQWINNSTQNNALGDMIAMVDDSGSMNGDPMNAAIALGIRVAEKSKLGRRIMTFSSTPKWVNLEGQHDFCSMVKTVSEAEWGMTTNFGAALNMILDAIISVEMEPEDVEGLTLAIFSDMQMDSADNSNKNTLYDSIKEKYADAGMRVKGRPYKPPHILFWNLRSTSGFPTLSTQPNASMMSGFSPFMLNLFCEKGIESLQSCTPWIIFLKSLKNDRYSIMEEKAREVF
jgi:hypothetical protein